MDPPHSPGEPSTCLFHLQEDPDQLKSRALSEPEVVSELLARWDAFRSARAGEQVAETLRLDPAFVALMRKSGYDFRPGEETTP